MIPWATAVLALLSVAYLGLGLFAATKLSAPNRRPAERTPEDVGLAYREVGFESTDGVPLAAWWLPPVDDVGSSRVVMLVHGWGGDKSDEHIIETARIYARAGYGVLLLDLRGSGGSGGERRTMGYTETSDVRGGLAWLEGEGFGSERVVLHGWSMGGATVVRSAPGAGVSAVVEEAGYADLPLILRKVLPEVSGLPRLFNPGVLLAARLFLGLRAYSVRPGEDAARLRKEGVPLFVIHSADDEVVPYLHAELFAEVYPEAGPWRLEGYEHVAAYTHPEYEERLLSFLEDGAFWRDDV